MASGFSPEATALFARMTTPPSSARKAIINNLIVALKAAGVWAKLDALYVFAAADSQAALLNWKGATYDATLSGAPTFTTDRGFQMSSGNYVDSNFNPTTAASPQFTQDNAHFSVWSRTSGSDANIDAGYSLSSFNLALRVRNTSDLVSFRINAASYLSVSNTNGSGFFLGSRSDSSSTSGYINGSLVGSGSYASVAPSSTTISFGRCNTNYSARQQSAGSIGANLTGSEVSNFYTALQAYMTAVGA